MSAGLLLHHPSVPPHHVMASPPLDELMLFGFISAFLSMVFFLHRHQSNSAALALAVCLIATAVYGALEASWPLVLMQLMFAASSLRRWWGGKPSLHQTRSLRAVHREFYDCESRISRMFGPA